MIVNMQTGSTIYDTAVNTYDYTYKKGDIVLKGNDAKTLLNQKNVYDDWTYIVHPDDLSKVTVIMNHEAEITSEVTTTGIAKDWLKDVAKIANNIGYYMNPPKNLYTGTSVEIHTTDENDNGKSIPLKINYYKTNVPGLYKAIYTNPEAINSGYEWLTIDAPILKLNKIIDTSNAYADYGANYLKQLMNK